MGTLTWGRVCLACPPPLRVPSPLSPPCLELRDLPCSFPVLQSNQAETTTQKGIGALMTEMSEREKKTLFAGSVPIGLNRNQVNFVVVPVCGRLGLFVFYVALV